MDQKYLQFMQDYGQYLRPQPAANPMDNLVAKYATGGPVQSYEDGGPVYDESNPDFASQVRANMNQNLLYNLREPQVANVQVAPVAQAAPEVALYRATQQAAADRRKLIEAINKKLEGQGDIPRLSDAERHFRLAAAFAKPTKTGHFGESLGNAAETMADIQAIKRQEQKDIYGQELERMKARLAISDQQYKMAQDQDMRELIAGYATDGNAVINQQASKAGMPASIPAQLRPLILAQAAEDPSKAVATLISIAKDNNSPGDLMKNLNYAVSQGWVQPDEAKEIGRRMLQPKVSMSKIFVPELRSEVDMSDREIADYTEKGIIPKRLGGEGAPAVASSFAPSVSGVATTSTPSAPSVSAPTQAAAPTKPATREQVQAEAEQLKEAGKEKVKASTALTDQREATNTQLQTVRRLRSIVDKDPSIVGITNKPGVGSAVVEFLKGADTPIGRIGVNLEEPIARATLGKQQLSDRNFAKQATQELIIGYRKMFLKGEGPVSNMEGALVEKLPPDIGDDYKSFQLKAGVVEIRAEKKAAVIDAFSKFQKTHPTAGPEDFYNTPEFKKISDAYDNKYTSFLSKNGFDVGQLKAAPVKGGSLVERLRSTR